MEVEFTTATLGQGQEQERDERDGKENKAEYREVQEPQTVELVHGTEQLIKQIIFHFFVMYIFTKYYLFLYLRCWRLYVITVHL